jgi:pimeloyl-ACP methyl ester carboxylesterase
LRRVVESKYNIERDGFPEIPKREQHDVGSERAAFMADSQVPWGVNALSGTIGEAAWNTKPSWYLVTTEDKMIPPAAQRLMAKRAGATMVEVAGSHAIYESQPNAVAGLIQDAAKGANNGTK